MSVAWAAGVTRGLLVPQSASSQVQAGTEDSTLIPQGVSQCILLSFAKQLSETVSLVLSVKFV